MKILLKIWGVMLIGSGGYCAYSLGDLLFVKGYIRKFPAFVLIVSLVGLLMSVSLVCFGIWLLVRKQKMAGPEDRKPEWEEEEESIAVRDISIP